MIKPIYTHRTANLLDSYRLLLTEFTNLNLERPISIYEIDATFDINDLTIIVLEFIEDGDISNTR